MTFPDEMDRKLIEINMRKERMAELPKTAGVYFIWNDKNEVIYVGSSTNLRQRLSQSFKERGGVAFSFIETDDYLEVEKKYIMRCCPALNMTYKEKDRSPIYPHQLRKYKFPEEMSVLHTKFVLKMPKEMHSDLLQISLNKGAKMGRQYSLTELINDVLKEYLEREK